MASSIQNESEATRALVHEGWNHLMSQRPLAAWGTWRRALRIDPESPAARSALATLESAPELPLAARKTHRFRQPRDQARRARWDDLLRSAPAEELDEAAEVFAELAREAPDDVEAWFNLGLCLAWRGRDREAVAALDRVVELEADHNQEGAVEAWTLAEILRQGGGAEALADDLRYACGFPWDDADTSILETRFPEIRKIPTPSDPTGHEVKTSNVEVMEWLDRPFPAAAAESISAAELPRVLATIYITPGSLRLSSPRVDALEEAEERLRLLINLESAAPQRAAAPLPLPFLDADVWTVRFPEGRDPADAERWSREVVEDYYENHWIHRPRQGLDGLSPLAAAGSAHAGDDAARAKLAAVIRLREQLGSRPSSAALYQGYPFDRLRRRLGLEPVDPASVDPADPTCASLWELRALAPQELEDQPLVDALLSALGLRDDELIVPLARALLDRRPEGLHRVSPLDLAAGLVRLESRGGRPDKALEWISRVEPLAGDDQRRTLRIWRAEILARAGRPEESAAVYQSLLAESPDDAPLALDAAETLLDNQHVDQARPFLSAAARLAETLGLRGVASRAARHLETIGIES